MKQLQPKRILGVGAHADDLDMHAGGSIAKWAAAGAEVYYLILTDGSRGSRDRSIDPAALVRQRQSEQAAAAKILGVTKVFFEHFTDGSLESSYDVKRAVVRRVRSLRPDTVIGWDPTLFYSTEFNNINHPDHRAAGAAAMDAFYPLARDHLSFPELAEEGLEPHITTTLLLMNYVSANFFVDIAGTIEQKQSALQAHTSQWESLKKDCGGAVALGQKSARNAVAAGFADMQIAEGFVRIDYVK